MPEPDNIQRVELINYKNDAGKELLGLGIELSELLDFGFQLWLLLRHLIFLI